MICHDCEGTFFHMSFLICHERTAIYDISCACQFCDSAFNETMEPTQLSSILDARHTECPEAMCLQLKKSNFNLLGLNDFDGSSSKDGECPVSELCALDIADYRIQNVAGSKTTLDQPMLGSAPEEPIRRLRTSSGPADKPRRFFRTFWRGLLIRALSAEKARACMKD